MQLLKLDVVFVFSFPFLFFLPPTCWTKHQNATFIFAPAAQVSPVSRSKIIFTSYTSVKRRKISTTSLLLTDDIQGGHKHFIIRPKTSLDTEKVYFYIANVDNDILQNFIQ